MTETPITYLRRLEWSGSFAGMAACPECSNKKDDGHAEGCRLAAALAFVPEGSGAIKLTEAATDTDWMRPKDGQRVSVFISGEGPAEGIYRRAPNPKEALERLKAWASLIERRAVDGDNSLAVEAEIADQHAADLRTLIAEREGLEREVERLTGESASHGFWRIVEFFDKIGLGTGDDPIGFLLASHAYMTHERNEARAKLAALEKTEQLHGPVQNELDPGEYQPPCTDPGGHIFVCRDDNEELSYCLSCGADGNA